MHAEQCAPRKVYFAGWADDYRTDVVIFRTTGSISKATYYRDRDKNDEIRIVGSVLTVQFDFLVKFGFVAFNGNKSLISQVNRPRCVCQFLVNVSPTKYHQRCCRYRTYVRSENRSELFNWSDTRRRSIEERQGETLRYYKIPLMFFSVLQSMLVIRMNVSLCFSCRRKTDGKKDECIVAQEKMHPACAQRVDGAEMPTCHSLAETCKENKGCRWGRGASRARVFENLHVSPWIIRASARRVADYE